MMKNSPDGIESWELLTDANMHIYIYKVSTRWYSLVVINGQQRTFADFSTKHGVVTMTAHVWSDPHRNRSHTDHILDRYIQIMNINNDLIHE